MAIKKKDKNMEKKTIKGEDFENGHLTVREGHGSVQNKMFCTEYQQIQT